MDNRLILLHCSLIDGFGPASLTKVINYLRNSNSNTLESIYSLKENDFERAGLSKELSKKLFNGLLDKGLLESELELIKKFDIQLLTILDEEPNLGFPELLKNIHLPPIVLYSMGERLTSFNKTIAIVGSRKCDNYGSRSLDLLLPDIVKSGWATVSGGAYGIDTLVHQKTMDLGGKTISVLGSGLLNIYPGSNKKLFRSISEGNGALISSFPLKAPPLAGNFPARNRIIAGLAQACLVVQAAQKSGALITAHFALEQSKDVGAIPGPIDNPLSMGCNDLIRQGAACITTSHQLLEFLGDDTSANDFKNELMQPKLEKISAENIINFDIKSQSFEALSIDEKILLLCRDAASFDELLVKTGLSFNDLNNKLLELQLKGLLSQNRFGLWESYT